MAGRYPAPAPPAATRFSGWRIVFLATVTASLSGPGQTVGVSVFVDHLIRDLALTRSEVSGAYLVGTLLGALALPQVGVWIDRIGVRRAMSAIGVAFGLALVLMAGVGSLVVLAIGFVFIRLFGQGALTLVSTVAVTHWFERRRGLALGIMMTAVAGLMSLVPVASSGLIGVVGWRSTWLIWGAIVWLVVVPVARLGMIDRPGAIGQRADGARAPMVEPAVSTAATRTEAVRMRSFWVVVAVGSVQAMLVTGLSFHQISLLGEAGLTDTQAALMFLPAAAGASVAALLFGVLTDRFRGGPVLAASMALLVLALLLASGLSSTTRVVVYASVVGAAGGSARSATAAVLPRWYGSQSIGSIAGLATFVGVAASAVGPLALSMAREATGDYGSAALWFAAVPAAVALIALATQAPKPRGELR